MFQLMMVELFLIRRINFIWFDLNYNSAGTRGGSLFNSGKLTALKINSNFNTAKDGGAIYTNSEMILSNSKLNNNKAENGGVIYSESLLTVDKSEFSSNEALIGSNL